MKVLTFGVFDYFHIGHLRLFKQCRKYGDYLIVAVQDSEYIKKYKPNSEIFYPTEIRMEMLNSLKEVDKVVSYNELNIETIKNIEFDILALGEDHIGGRFDMVTNWCKENGKRVVRLKRTPNVCSSSIKEIINK